VRDTTSALVVPPALNPEAIVAPHHLTGHERNGEEPNCPTGTTAGATGESPTYGD